MGPGAAGPAGPSHHVAAPLSKQARTMHAATTAGLSTAARTICSGFYPIASMAQRGKRTQRRQAQAVSWAVKSSAAEPSHHVAAPLSNQARTMHAATTAGLSTATRPTCNGLYPITSVAPRGNRTQRQSTASGLMVTSCTNFNETSLSSAAFATVSLSFIRQRGYRIEYAADGPCCRAQASGGAGVHRSGLIAQRSYNMMRGLRGSHRP